MSYDQQDQRRYQPPQQRGYQQPHQPYTGGQPQPGQAPYQQQPGYQQPGQRPWPGYQQPQRPPGQRLPGRRRPPQGPWFRRHRGWSIAIVAFVVLLAIGGIESAVKGGHKQQVAGTVLSSAKASQSTTAQPTPQAARSSAAPASKTKPKTKAKSNPGSKINAEANACDNRPNASGDIYVWMLVPGTQAVAQELGGEWRWDSETNTCLTSVQLMLAAAPTSPGTCTQVGYVVSNPGYNADATPARRLEVLAGEKGPAC